MSGAGLEPDFLQLQNARATAALLEQLGITAPIRFGVATTVVPVAVITETDPTKNDKLAWGSTVITGAAGVQGHIQLFNPVNSGVVIHVDSVVIFAASAVALNVTEHDTALTTLATTVDYRDRRVLGSPVGQVRAQTNAGQLGNIRFRSTLGTAAELLPLDAFLEAGQGLLVLAVTNNITLTASYYWEELPAGVGA